jgi:hypothetical protein
VKVPIGGFLRSATTENAQFPRARRMRIPTTMRKTVSAVDTLGLKIGSDCTHSGRISVLVRTSHVG